ncbi:MAG: FAD-dependent oxidoreductase [Solirubrobacteraceae bacterium]
MAQLARSGRGGPADRRPVSDLGGGPDLVRGWGCGEGSWVWRWRPRDSDALRAGFASTVERCAAGAIARGMGRSYGDAAQRSGGVVIDATQLKGMLLDEDGGVVRAGAGVTVGELLAATIARGWILPVVPGTQHVSVGGAIASDIHGKNHATLGTFGTHVQRLGLLSADGELLELSPGIEAGLFEATVGGMGLTGVILWAELALRRVRSAMLSVDLDRATGFDEALSLLSSPGGEHRVAWLDLLSGSRVRGIVTRAAHCEHQDAASLAPASVASPARFAVPSRWPGGVLRTSAVRAFNELRLRRSPRRERGRPWTFGAHMFPLDGLDAWPRLYGPGGMVQYQFVVPRGAEQVLARVIDSLARDCVPCFLAVLKDMGPEGTGMLSFPLAGWTLALDLPRRAAGVHEALERCDELVVQAGGRVYLSKDSRMRAEIAGAMYPRLAEWRGVREGVDPRGVWQSDLALRTGLVGGPRR